MRLSRQSHFSAPSFILGALTVVLATGTPTVGADYVYFVQRQISTSPTGGSAAMSRFDLGPRPVAGKRPTPAPPKIVNGAVNRVTRTDRAGGSLKVIYETDRMVVAVSASSDESRIVCHLLTTGAAAAKFQPGKIVSQIIILLPDGTVETKVDLSELGVRVVGTPVLLPDKKHIGLTVCRLPDDAELQRWMSMQGQQGQQGQPAQPPASRFPIPRPNDPQSAKAMLEQLGPQPTGQFSMGSGIFPNQPYIATVDLRGHDLKQIGPGAMPCWSPDGKAILFTSVTVPGPFAGAEKPRLSIMNDDGSDAHPIAAELTWDGWFSRDGKRIAYVSKSTGSSSGIMTADADGSNAETLKLPASIYASPRWLPDGRAICYATRAETQAKSETNLRASGVSGHASRPSGVGEVNSVWIAGDSGTAPHRVSPVPAANIHGSGIDQDAEAFLMYLVFPHSSAIAPGAAEEGGPDGKATDSPRANPERGLDAAPPYPVARGSTIETKGKITYIRAPNGQLTPIPDGNYQLPNGDIVRVRGGKQVTDAK